MKIFAALDIGGTFIKYGTVSEKGEVVTRFETPTEGRKGAAYLMDRICGIIDSLLKNTSEIAGIGISTAGIVDSDTGTIVYANDNFPGYAGVNVKATLEKKFEIPVLVNNDVNSAALAEHWVGSAMGVKTFFCMTVGTGIGGAILIDGKLFRGSNFMAAEVCYFNKKGRDEYYENRASVTALIDMVKKELDPAGAVDGVSIFNNINAGAAEYFEIFERWTDELSAGIANVICMFDPGLVLIGGGVSRQKIFIDAVRRKIKGLLPPVFVEGTVINAAGCGNDAGMIGSVYEFKNIKR
ncbi:MAG: hypothetical protein A2008_08160 [Candidatus Wallbacteria bacterium GWC2_49_35]|uniref:Sugar kinase n=1 Tax=Candidatus Wallbacteria bacterium GWC2_49_35 TaxID=1817813 RepID=A0A1F7WNS9_9BACT|nr:MAG: hypothetical protein A2008_08160 [Candidatus Wallbacteria bacterium GWC2_49_35]HBC75056.1 ROK family protein [Candidatus Wallbacteria bacterium]